MEIRAQVMQNKLRLQRQALADFGLFAFQCDDIDNLLHRACELVSVALEVPLVKVLEHLPERGEMLIRGGVNWEPGVVGHELLVLAQRRVQPEVTSSKIEGVRFYKIEN